MLNVSCKPFISLVCHFSLVGWLHPRRLTAKGPEKMMVGRPSGGRFSGSTQTDLFVELQISSGN